MTARVPHRDSPAPWKVYRAPNGTLLGVGDKNSGGVTDYQGGFWGSGAGKRANVFLIAAAPELYTALNRLADAAGATDYDPDSDLCQAIMEAVAALAKARGETA